MCAVCLSFAKICFTENEALGLLKKQLDELENSKEKSFATQTMLDDVNMRIKKYSN